MFKWFSRLSYSTKILSVFACTLSFALFATTWSHIQTAATVMEEESTQNLEMLTEQVALNFSESQESMSYSIYSRMAALELPVLMDRYNQSRGSSSALAGLRYALSQAVSDSSEYDFMMLELEDGIKIDSGRKSRDPATAGIVKNTCLTLLEEHPEVTFGNSNWYRSSDDGVYILRDVYATSPLRRVGKAVVHMRGTLFSVSEVYENTGFLFFNQNGEYLSSAGMEIPEKVRESIINDLSDGVLDTQTSWGEEEHYSVSRLGGRWLTVGVSSTIVYQRMLYRILKNGIFFGFIGLLLGIAVLAVLIRVLNQKLADFKKNMNSVAEGDFTKHIEVKGEDDISQLADTMNYMTNRIRELLDELVEKERVKKDTEIQMMEYKYRSLETQIRPHFIYNALETINALAKMRGDMEISEIVQRISRYFRGITVNTTRQFITCQQEFDMLRDYTEVYRFIHGDKLKVTFSAKEAARGALVSTMIIQPIVENALQHGVRSQNEASEIIVHAYVTDDRLNITVKDTGYGLSPQMEQKLQTGQVEGTKQGGIGVGNVRQRLRLIYGDNASFTIGNRPEGGVVVKVSIPLTYIEPDLLGDDDLDWDLD